ncbi:hypothetical protein KUCAC02_023115, partial [Chaenocephalus aceratus]
LYHPQHYLSSDDIRLIARQNRLLCVMSSSEVSGFVEVSLPGGKPKPFNLVACGPPYPTLVCTRSSSIPGSVAEVRGQELA